MTEPIRVAVAGARGRVGRELVRAVDSAPDLALVGGLSHTAGASVELGSGRSLALHTEISTLLEETRPAVLVDFTLPHVAMPIAVAALESRVPTIIGTSGLGAVELQELRA